MSYMWETKFKPENKVKCCDGRMGTVVQIHIMYPSGEDMDHWRKTLPKKGDGKYQHTSYEVKLSDKETYDYAEDGLILIV